MTSEQHSASAIARARINEVRDEITRTAKIAGRAPEAVTLIAVSKTYPAEAIKPFIAAGQREFGENRVQEAQSKWPAILADHADIDLHLIGSLQSNKAEDAVTLFGTIHAVDRVSLITALAKAQDKVGRRPRCFIQVNIGDEAQKGGCGIADLAHVLQQAQSANLDIVGLMAVPPAHVEASPYFALLAKLARDNGLEELSMGMSADLEPAVLLGATYVRVGTALFGARPPI